MCNRVADACHSSSAGSGCRRLRPQARLLCHLLGSLGPDWSAQRWEKNKATQERVRELSQDTLQTTLSRAVPTPVVRCRLYRCIQKTTSSFTLPRQQPSARITEGAGPLARIFDKIFEPSSGRGALTKRVGTAECCGRCPVASGCGSVVAEVVAARVFLAVEVPALRDSLLADLCSMHRSTHVCKTHTQDAHARQDKREKERDRVSSS